jgi:hypothetical protein
MEKGNGIHRPRPGDAFSIEFGGIETALSSFIDKSVNPSLPSALQESRQKNKTRELEEVLEGRQGSQDTVELV